jgi:hypothetical protein
MSSPKSRSPSNVSDPLPQLTPQARELMVGIGVYAQEHHLRISDLLRRIGMHNYSHCAPQEMVRGLAKIGIKTQKGTVLEAFDAFGFSNGNQIEPGKLDVLIRASRRIVLAPSLRDDDAGSPEQAHGGNASSGWGGLRTAVRMPAPHGGQTGVVSSGGRRFAVNKYFSAVVRRAAR